MAKRVLVAMSGGVDSSVAAARLLDAGWDVTGVTLRLWGGESDSGCCSVSDVEDARRVASQLGIPHYVFNLSEDFEQAVVDPYVGAYAAGLTPNPCVECNRSIKFGRLLDRADALGFEAVATGHHARVSAEPGGFALRRGRDLAKDQSYVLYMLGHSQLARLLLPVGEMTKAQVRGEAERLRLRTADKPESMEVCFITRGGRETFLAQRGAMVAGDIVDPTGAVLGHHDGTAAFTIGQRRGVGVATGERRYVTDIDARTGRVTLGGPKDLLCASVTLTDLSFTGGAPDPTEVLDVQVRAHGRPFPGTLAGRTVHFAEPHPRVAPGQIVALYRGDALVGGAPATP